MINSPFPTSSTLITKQPWILIAGVALGIVIVALLCYYFYSLDSKVSNILEIEKFNLSQNIKNTIMLESISNCLKCENIISDKINYLKSQIASVPSS